ncbi:MAG: hypothetical protein WBP64_00725, partial [Nitrososphaeraceae archaeon]
FFRPVCRARISYKIFRVISITKIRYSSLYKPAFSLGIFISFSVPNVMRYELKARIRLVGLFWSIHSVY